MYRVMIVDDELLDLEWLAKRVPWVALGLRLEAQASSAFMALRLLQEEKFDMLITDIQMPIMNGLELVRKARELQPNLQVLIISGHEDFRYAKQAIEMKAVGYILKPVDTDELLISLRSMIQTLDEFRIHQSRAVTVETALPYVRVELLLRWLSGEDTILQPDAVNLYGLTLSAPLFNAAIIEVDDLEWKLPEDMRSQTHSRLMQTIEQFADEWPIGQLCKLPASSRYVLLMDGYGPTAADALQELIRTIHAQGSLTISIGIGLPCEDIRDLPGSFRQAKEALACKLFLGKNRLISYGQWQERQEKSEGVPGQWLEDMFESVIAYDLVGIDNCMEALFKNLGQPSNRSSVHHFAMGILSKLDILLHSINEDLYHVLGVDFEHLDVIYRFETISDVKSWLRRRMFELSELLKHKRENTNQKLVQEIEKYVDEHIGEKVTLRDLAHTFGFSPNYLGYLFKETTGTHFSDFMIRKKLDTACRLLLDPKLKIYEVAGQIGYRNIIYFNRQFKETLGMSPTEYRTKHKVK
ncbi:two-component system response regulator YesN [Paenibacillus rhizosphaerae]|uniref:Two-component system response regulator YesN n=1 Tax=Paenibacillus rhizosphaerae TaxID=297318 RepID=A0A839TNP8_9BACL|nr:response regulator [Paenibacillus rhizosphaerae]MBB3127048.1 two-component system response regulator YesN [Paenibacillus rhizosphaerae]